MPAPELFPVEGVKEAAIQTLNERGQAALQYASTEGDPALRKHIVARMEAKNGVKTDADHILVTSGSECAKEDDQALCIHGFQGRQALALEAQFAIRVIFDNGHFIFVDDFHEFLSTCITLTTMLRKSKLFM